MPYQRYNLDSAETSATILDGINVQLLYVTRSRCDAQWQSMMHTHPFTELFYIVDGQGKFLVEDDVRFVKNDDFIIINPNVLHTELSDTKTSFEYIVLGIDGLSFQTEKDQDANYGIYNFKNHRTDMLFYMKSIIRELHQKSSGYREICTNLLETLVLLILRNTFLTRTISLCP